MKSNLIFARFSISLAVFGLLPFLVASPYARAQTPPASPPKPIILTLRAVAFEKEMDDLFVRSGGKELSLSVPAFGVSREYRYSGPTPVVIYRRPPKSAESDARRPEPQPVGSVTIDPEWTRALVFLFPNRDGTLIVHAVRSDNDHFHNGTLRAYNLTDQPLLLRIDGRDQVIDSGKELQFSPPEGSHQTAIRYGLKGAKGVRWVGGNYFSVPDKGRTTIILARTDSDYFRPIGLDNTVYAAKPVQVFSFSETIPPDNK